MRYKTFQLTEEDRRKVEDFRAQHKTGVLTILFTDMVGSTDLKSELGDTIGSSLIIEQQKIVRELLSEFSDGEEIDTAGDSFLIAFTRPSDAVRFSLLLHSRLRNASIKTPRPIMVRIGIHMGEVYYQEKSVEGQLHDIIGLQVDIAFRMIGLAIGGQTLMTCGVFNNARAIITLEETKELNILTWLNHGPYRFKGIEELIDVCEVEEEGIAPLLPPPDSEKAHRYISKDIEPVIGWRPALNQEVPTAPGWILIEKLGEGGFGEVWKGQHKVLKEIRVFKFCFRADKVRSLKREVTLFRLLKEQIGEHPHIVHIYDVYFDEPPYYIQTEFVDGKNLKEWCNEQGGVKSIPLQTKVEIIVQVADALQSAHDVGIIHRDIKPSNILIRSKGTSPEEIHVKLTDFGISEITSKEVLECKTGLGFTETFPTSELFARSGTRLYMAPEVLAGKRAQTQSDIYSLGVVLYQLLIGNFNTPITTDWKQYIFDSIIARDLEKCFVGNPEYRFSSASQFALNLRKLELRRKMEKAKQLKKPFIKYIIIILILLGIFMLLIIFDKSFQLKLGNFEF